VRWVTMLAEYRIRDGLPTAEEQLYTKGSGAPATNFKLRMIGRKPTCVPLRSAALPPFLLLAQGRPEAKISPTSSALDRVFSQQVLKLTTIRGFCTLTGFVGSSGSPLKILKKAFLSEFSNVWCKL